MAGIYVHIPFCKQACYYCDFHFSTNQTKQEEIVHAIVAEIGMQKEYLNGEPIETIYLGGGTPSLLAERELSIIFQAIHKNYSVKSEAEVTLEANPDDLSVGKLRELRNAGVNRLSIGIQSFDDGILKSLNRAHDSNMARNCVHEVHYAGFDNISIDLIYAIPEQDDKLWKANIHEALLLKPQHISSYALTLEEKTVFGRWVKQGKMKALDEDLAATQLNILVDTLENSGYEQYEVSNFSQPGFRSQHNSSYWRNEKYLGVGPSAHSYNGESRQYNISNNTQYLNAILKQQIPATHEILSREDKINEYLLTTLRTSWGTDLEKLRREYKFDLLAENSFYIQALQDSQFATLENDMLVLTKTGKLLADKIASDLFAVV